MKRFVITILIIIVIIAVGLFEPPNDAWNEIVKPQYDSRYNLTWDEYVEFWSDPLSSLPDAKEH
jgi:hypothetical protein